MKNKRLFLTSLFLVLVAIVFSACSFSSDPKIEFIVDGRVYATQTLKEGKFINAPEDPTMEGYEFDGWFWDYDEWQVPFTGNEMIDGLIDGDAEVFAKWNEVTTPEQPGEPEEPSEPEVPDVPQEPSGPEVVTYTVTMNLNYTTTDVIFGTLEVEEGKDYKLPVPTREGYTFLAWRYSSTELTDTQGNSLQPYEYTNDITVYAYWTRYSLSVVNSSSTKGTSTIISNKYTTAGTEITVVATPNEGYKFVGWVDYNDSSVVYSTELTYTFTMPYKNLKISAKWEDAKYRVTTSVYDEDNFPGCLPKFDNEYKHGKIATLNAKSDYNYTFLGWYKDGEIYSTNKTIQVTVTEDMDFVAHWTKIYLEVEISSYSSAKLSVNYSGEWKTGSYKYKELTTPNTAVEMKVETNPGYTWMGWYKNDEFLTKDFEISYDTTTEDCKFFAKFITCPVTIASIDLTMGSVSMPETSTLGEYITIKAQGEIGYVFKGWFKLGEAGNTECVTTELEYEVCVGEEQQDFVAMWEICENHDYINCYCVCGAEYHNPDVYCRHDNLIVFGSYPQSLVEDETIVETLNEVAKTPKANNNWISYKYIYGHEPGMTTRTINMSYIDLELGGEKYRGVYQEHYRPSWSRGDAETVDGGYLLKWYKYEPIKWTVLGEEDGKVLIMSNSVIDGQPYELAYSEVQTYDGSSYSYTYYAYDAYNLKSKGVGPQTWYTSYIREWLNKTFWSSAFSTQQQNIVSIHFSEGAGDLSAGAIKDCDKDYVEGGTTIKAEYPNDTSKIYDGVVYTFDRVFLTSTNTMEHVSQEARKKIITDYAGSQGAYEMFGYSNYWLRTHSTSRLSRKVNLSRVTYDGKLEEKTGTNASFAYNYTNVSGVVPVMVLNLG